MSFDLILKSSCSGCGSTTDLYGSNCKHMTLCLTCGKTMAENRGKCYDCGAVVTRLIRVCFFPFSNSIYNSFFLLNLVLFCYSYLLVTALQQCYYCSALPPHPQPISFLIYFYLVSIFILYIEVNIDGYWYKEFSCEVIIQCHITFPPLF